MIFVRLWHYKTSRSISILSIQKFVSNLFIKDVQNLIHLCMHGLYHIDTQVHSTYTKKVPS